MTGGVSLAIWMGGAAHELNRVVRRDADVYQQLLDLTATTARVDVIAGTSAGGLNGALLAMAQVHDADLSCVRGLWLRRGALERLLRSPTVRDPPSLMKGDAYFLPAIRSALDALQNRPLDRLPDVESVPVHLIITATLLGGIHRGIPDNFGSIIHDLDHRGEFTFRRGPGPTHHRADGCDHPAGRADMGDDWAEPDTLARIALAARGSASFPFAFEPSFCPVDDSPDPLHPDMACHANFPVTRWAVDGGVLVNKPLRPALEAIFEQAATRQVRRVLAYLVPDPGIEQKDLADELADAPTMGQVGFASLVSLPRNESVFSELDRIRDHNARVAGQRRRRQTAVEAGVARSEELATTLYDRYRRVRAEQVANRLIDLIAHGAATSRRERRRDVPLWDPAQLRGGFISHLSVMPPNAFPTGDAPIEAWFTTLDALERAGAVALDMLARPLRLLNPTAPELDREKLEALRLQRGRVHEALREGRARTPRLDPKAREKLAADALAALAADELAEQAEGLVMRVVGRPPGRWPQLREVAGAMAAGAPIALEVARDASGGEAPGAYPQVADAAALAAAFADAPNEDAVLRRLLALEVIQLALAAQPPVVEQTVEILQLSADAGNGFDPRDEPLEKLAGMQLGHFGAFYKQSWRANDWMWGRLDGAQRLTQVLVDPARLRQLGYSVNDAADAIEEIAFGDLDDEDERTLRAAQPRVWDRAVAERELAFLAQEDAATPVSLPICAQAAARRLQIDILREELPWIARAVEADAEDGGSHPDARPFAVQMREAGEKPSAAKLVELFDACRIGEERLRYDGSPLLARTATQSLAVTTSLVSGTHSGLGNHALKVRRALRGVSLLPYLLVLNAAARTRIGAAVVLATMAAAGALLGAGLVVGHGTIVSIGAAVLLAGLAVAILGRRGWVAGILFVAVALVAALPRILRETIEWPPQGTMDVLEVPWVVFWLVVAAALLGYFGVVWPEGGEKRPKRRRAGMNRQGDGPPSDTDSSRGATVSAESPGERSATSVGGGAFPWDLAIQIVGLGAALAAWVAVVGGGKLWARWEAAEIPTTQTLASLPRELMITEGLQTLLVPLLLGAGAALLLLAVVPECDPDKRGFALYGSRGVAWIAALGSVGLILILAAIAEVNPIIVAIAFGLASLLAIVGVAGRWPVVAGASIVVALVGVLLAIILAIEGWALGAMVVITLAAVALATIFLMRVRRRYAALTLFIAFVVWAGALGFVQEAGDRDPKLEHAAVLLKRGGDEFGYYLGRSSDRLYLAQNRDDGNGGRPRHVLVLENDDIERVVYGTGVKLPEAGGPAGGKQEGPGPNERPGTGSRDKGGETEDDVEDEPGKGKGGGTTKPEDQPPQPPALPFQTPSDRGAGILKRVRVELHILALARRGQLFELDAWLVNVSDVRGQARSLRVADALDDRDVNNEAFTIDNIRLVASGRRELYQVLYDDEGHCACTQRLDRAVLDPGESWRLWAAFPAPNASVGQVDLAAPGFAWIRDIDVD
jgi:patatin-related protein